MRNIGFKLYDRKLEMMFDVVAITNLDRGEGFVIGRKGDSGGEYFSTSGYLGKRTEIDGAMVNRFELLQDSGLKDKNGTKIYESFIVELINADLEKIRAVCAFGTVQREIYGNVVDITGFYFRILPHGRKTFPLVNNYLGKHDLELFEVIGNRFENPELMEMIPIQEDDIKEYQDCRVAWYESLGYNYDDCQELAYADLQKRLGN